MDVCPGGHAEVYKLFESRPHLAPTIFRLADSYMIPVMIVVVEAV